VDHVFLRLRDLDLLRVEPLVAQIVFTEPVVSTSAGAVTRTSAPRSPAPCQSGDGSERANQSGARVGQEQTPPWPLQQPCFDAQLVQVGENVLSQH
jgi:hypothetical protein